MNKIIALVFIAALVCSGMANADGRVLSVVSPTPEELKEPAKATKTAKPAQPVQKASASKVLGKIAKKTAKKTGKKVAAPAASAEAEIQPLGNGRPESAKAETAKEEPKSTAMPVDGKESKEAAPLMVPEPQMVNLGKQRAAEKTAKVEKLVVPSQVYVLFQSKPANAEVVVDGYYAGSTPLELPIKEGNHSLRIIYPGYEEWERKFNAYKGMRVSAILVEKRQAPVAP